MNLQLLSIERGMVGGDWCQREGIQMCRESQHCQRRNSYPHYALSDNDKSDVEVAAAAIVDVDCIDGMHRIVNRHPVQLDDVLQKPVSRNCPKIQHDILQW